MRAKTVIINANIACNIETGNTNKRNEKFYFIFDWFCPITGNANLFGGIVALMAIYYDWLNCNNKKRLTA